MFGQVASALVGGLFGNRQAKKGEALAREQMATAREVAQAQMDFQERMSSTAYQRAAKDLEAAGLNRILALGSPASSPGGAQPNLPSLASGYQAGASAGAAKVNAAIGVLNGLNSAKVAHAQSRKLNAEADRAENINQIVTPASDLTAKELKGWGKVWDNLKRGKAGGAVYHLSNQANYEMEKITNSAHNYIDEQLNRWDEFKRQDDEARKKLARMRQVQ